MRLCFFFVIFAFTKFFSVAQLAWQIHFYPCIQHENRMCSEKTDSLNCMSRNRRKKPKTLICGSLQTMMKITSTTTCVQNAAHFHVLDVDIDVSFCHFKEGIINNFCDINLPKIYLKSTEDRVEI